MSLSAAGMTHKEWLEWRQGHVGGSEVAALFPNGDNPTGTEHPFMSLHDLWKAKTGRSNGIEENNYIRRGRALEDPAATEYVELTGRKIRRVPPKKHPDFDFLGASADREIMRAVHPERGVEETGALEIKVVSWKVMQAIRTKGLRPYYVLQGQTEAMVLRKSYTDFGILNADSWKLLSLFDIQADPQIQEQILNRAGDFWLNHVQKDEPPAQFLPWEQPEHHGVDLPTGNVEIANFDDDPQWQQLSRDYVEAKELLDQAKELVDEAKANAMGFLEGEGIKAAQSGDVRWYIQERPGRRTFQSKELEAVKPLDPIKVAAQLNETLPLDDAMAFVYEDCGLDLDQFYKTGKPSRFVRPFILRGSE